MKLFIQFHRSITDPSFYKEVISLPPKKVFSYLIKIFLITVFILSIAHTSRVIDQDDGIPSILTLSFPEMEISNNRMISNRETPYIVNPVYVSKLVSVISDMPVSPFIIQDSLIIVDSKRLEGIDKNSSIRFLLTTDSIYINFGYSNSFGIPYSSLIPRNEILKFNKIGLSTYLKKRLFKLYMNFFIFHTISFGINILFSMLFLSFAAFIFFNRSKMLKYKVSLRIAVYASSPIVLESIFSSIAGVKIVWVWHIAVFISMIILYRAKNCMFVKENINRRI